MSKFCVSIITSRLICRTLSMIAPVSRFYDEFYPNLSTYFNVVLMMSFLSSFLSLLLETNRLQTTASIRRSAGIHSPTSTYIEASSFTDLNLTFISPSVLRMPTSL